MKSAMIMLGLFLPNSAVAGAGTSFAAQRSGTIGGSGMGNPSMRVSLNHPICLIETQTGQRVCKTYRQWAKTARELSAGAK